MVIELRVVQFWSEIILVISNRTRATRMISDQIALHSVQLPLLIDGFAYNTHGHFAHCSQNIHTYYMTKYMYLDT